MIQAIEHFGIFKGVFLGLKRLCKCHPWHEGGMDPVPACTCKKVKEKEPNDDRKAKKG